jgi:glycosyltransferase involved in cell wall biosynthesis
LRCRCTRHEPQAGVGFDERRKVLPPIGSYVLYGVGFVHDDEVKPSVYEFFTNNFYAIKVNDNELNKFYDSCNIFALLSNKSGYNFEGYGIVYLEALAKGKQVIISEESGGADIKKVNKKIFITEPDAYNNISNFIKKIYYNKILLTPKENVLVYRKTFKNNVDIFNKFKKSISINN